MDECVPSTTRATANPDVPLKAIILEDPPMRIPYPYAAGHDVGATPAQATRWLGPPPPPLKTYVVPRRFGMLGILALMTGMAILFAFLRFLGAPPAVFLFLGLMAAAICVVQMAYGKIPRLASAATGAIVSPLVVVTGLLIYEDIADLGLMAIPVLGFMFIYWGALGAFLGYVMGTLAAGIFLAVEKIEPYLSGGQRPASGGELPVDQEPGPTT